MAGSRKGYVKEKSKRIFVVLIRSIENQILKVRYQIP